MDTYDLEISIKDVNISKKWQNKLKKLRSVLKSTYWQRSIDSDNIETWHEYQTLKQSLNIYYYPSGSIDIFTGRNGHIDPDNIRLIEKILGEKVSSIENKGEKLRLWINIQSDYEKRYAKSKMRVSSKHDIQDVPLIGKERKIYV